VTDWEPGVPLYTNPRVDFTEAMYDRQIVRSMVDVFEDHKDTCGFCKNGVSGKSMTVTFGETA